LQQAGWLSVANASLERMDFDCLFALAGLLLFIGAGSR
jgi:hypothetical protein